jgi:hypothetical protein
VLSGKRALILADDAKDAAQVRRLLPPAGCALLVTSRNRFSLPGMAAIYLGMLPPDEAEKLLLKICPRIGAHAGELAKLCGYLPLALRVSAGVLAGLALFDQERRHNDAGWEWAMERAGEPEADVLLRDYTKATA